MEKYVSLFGLRYNNMVYIFICHLWTFVENLAVLSWETNKQGNEYLSTRTDDFQMFWNCLEQMTMVKYVNLLKERLGNTWITN